MRKALSFDIRTDASCTDRKDPFDSCFLHLCICGTLQLRELPKRVENQEPSYVKGGKDDRVVIERP